MKKTNRQLTRFNNKTTNSNNGLARLTASKNNKGQTYGPSTKCQKTTKVLLVIQKGLLNLYCKEVFLEDLILRLVRPGPKRVRDGNLTNNKIRVYQNHNQTQRKNPSCN